MTSLRIEERGTWTANGLGVVVTGTEREGSEQPRGKDQPFEAFGKDGTSLWLPRRAKTRTRVVPDPRDGTVASLGTAML